MMTMQSMRLENTVCQNVIEEQTGLCIRKFVKELLAKLCPWGV